MTKLGFASLLIDVQMGRLPPRLPLQGSKMTRFEHMPRNNQEMAAMAIGAALFLGPGAETLRLSRP